jgi:hypothetical protein
MVVVVSSPSSLSAPQHYSPTLLPTPLPDVPFTSAPVALYMRFGTRFVGGHLPSGVAALEVRGAGPSVRAAVIILCACVA